MLVSTLVLIIQWDCQKPQQINCIYHFLFYDDARIIGLELKFLSDNIYLLNVYLPYQCHGNYDANVEYIGKISAIIEDCSTSKLAIIGDINAKVGTIFESELISFCSDRQLIIQFIEALGWCCL